MVLLKQHFVVVVVVVVVDLETNLIDGVFWCTACFGCDVYFSCDGVYESCRAPKQLLIFLSTAKALKNGTFH